MERIRAFALRLCKASIRSVRQVEEALERRGHRSPLRRAGPLRTTLSVVSPLYNVAPYLDAFLASLTSQSTGLKNVEIILVDDGSTDATPAIAQAWVRRFPRVIRYVRQDNRGPAAARNAGLALASGNWVTFPDSDDYLSRNYFAVIDDELGRAHRQPPLMISIKLVFFREDSGSVSDTHPLKHRYASARTERSSWELGNFIQLSASHVCIDRTAVQANGLTFDARVRPSFEDGHFVNRLLLAEPNRSVVFRNQATYYYRKRASQDSLIDGSTHHPEWYGAQLRHGYLDLLERAAAGFAHVPRFLQTTILYDIFWRFRHLAGNDARANLLSEAQKIEFLELLERIFARIDTRTILEQSIGGLHEEHRIALLAMYKAQVKSPVVYLKQVDPQRNLLQVAHFTATDETVEARVDGIKATPRFASRRRVSFLGKLYFEERRFWVEVAAPSDEIEFRLDGIHAEIRAGSVKRIQTISLDRAVVVLRPKPEPSLLKNRQAAALRSHARSGDAVARFAKCWLLMDRDDAADDNAEHFYRYLMRIGQADRAFFVIRRDSADWPRLSKQGFKLVPWLSEDHAAALANAEFLISSHIDEFIRWPFPAAWLRDLVTYQFVFLQHGVAKHDISRWINPKKIALLVTASPAEHLSITSCKSNYLFSEKEVKLTGLPRHDSLLSGAPSGTRIMIMPTWRRNLVGDPVGVGMKRDKSAAMIRSEFFRRWRSLLDSERLKRIAGRSGSRVLFCPHPNLADYLEDFDLADHVEPRDPRKPPSLQTSLRESAVLITDFSSIAFEMAYLDRPVLYYQFDRAGMFGGEHLFDRGYFDYDRDGFGPVAFEEDALFDNLEVALAGREEPQYAQRRLATFPFRDGQCCERVYRAILDLSAPVSAGAGRD